MPCQAPQRLSATQPHYTPASWLKLKERKPAGPLISRRCGRHQGNGTRLRSWQARPVHAPSSHFTCRADACAWEAGCVPLPGRCRRDSPWDGRDGGGMKETCEKWITWDWTRGLDTGENAVLQTCPCCSLRDELMMYLTVCRASQVAQTVKDLQATQESWVRSLGQEDPWRRKWQPTPVLLPGKFHGQRSLVGYSPRGPWESDTTKQLTLSLS